MASTRAPLVAFFDIDGTLIDSNPESYAKAQAPGASVEDQERVFLPTPAVREAIGKFVDEGNLAFLCSGRPPSGLSLLMERVPFSGYVALAGALGEMEGQELFCHTVDRALMARAIEIFDECSVAALLEGTRGSVVFKPAGEHPDIDLSVPVVESADEATAVIDDLALVKAFWMAEENDRLAAHMAELQDLFRVSDLGVGGFELTVPEVSKASGMADVLAAVGTHGTVYGFGDSENDIPMLKAADVAVVMDNGVPAVKELADVVAPSVSEDGVATTLRRILAGEL
ncbi:HAD-IIB family hydrolase [Atopobiaceae bacterium 24-176]